MNIAIILAGGTGTRLGADKPKQFIKVLGKPVIAYTLDVFQKDNNIDAIEIVCHKDWIEYVRKLVTTYNIDKTKWIATGGSTFQESTMNGVFNLKDKISRDDIVVISFGVSPMTSPEIIDDSIRVCKEHGNGISSEDIDLCTCIKDKDDECSSISPILRETLKGFSNPWTFNFGELCDVYTEAEKKGILKTAEPHTTSLYFALGKRIYFSKSDGNNYKITHKEDLDKFEGYLLVQQKRKEQKLQ